MDVRRINGLVGHSRELVEDLHAAAHMVGLNGVTVATRHLSDNLRELGIRLNALPGSLPPPELIDAWRDAQREPGPGREQEVLRILSDWLSTTHGANIPRAPHGKDQQ